MGFCGWEWVGIIYILLSWKANHGNTIYPILECEVDRLLSRGEESLFLPTVPRQICATAYGIECSGSDAVQLRNFEEKRKYSFYPALSHQGHSSLEPGQHAVRKSRLNRETCVIISDQLGSQPTSNTNPWMCEWMNLHMPLFTIFWVLHSRPHILRISLVFSAWVFDPQKE